MTTATISLSAPLDQAGSSLRFALRDATLQVHTRMHGHDGFAAIQDETIGLASYRDLLARLYGFYVPFEAEAGIGVDRSGWLREDLASLGLTSEALRALPRCADIPSLANAGRRLGALYVVEGSALGGRVLARKLSRLFVGSEIAGRRFFLSGGSPSGSWSGFLGQLAAVPDDRAVWRDIVLAAMETFEVFEDWMSEWQAEAHD